MRHLPSLLLIIICLWVFSPLGYVLFDADQAVHVLMGRDFSRWADLYYWGQDRLGSLLPLLAWPLNALFSPLWAYSLAMGFVLIGWYVGLLKMLPSNLATPLFAFLLFPAFPFLYGVLPGQPYLAQTLFTIWGAWWLAQRKNTRQWWIVWIVLGTLAVWSSELSGAFFGFASMGYLLELRRVNGKMETPRHALTIVGAGAVGLGFLLMAKNQAQGVGEYLRVLATPEEVAMNVKNLARWTGDHLWFRVAETGTSVAFWLTMAVVGWSLIQSLRRWKSAPLHAQMLWLSGIATLAFLPLSHWAALMGTDPRYFIPVVVQLALAGALVAGKQTTAWGWLLAGTALASLAGCLQVVTAKDTLVEWKPPRAAFEELALKTKRPALATYWIAYPYAALHPNEITALPHNGEYVRNMHQLPALLNADTIDVIGNFWLETYPDTLRQFNHVLVKAGEPDASGSLHHCAYRWVRP